jgi:predicted phosphodiesterase
MKKLALILVLFFCGLCFGDVTAYIVADTHHGETSDSLLDCPNSPCGIRDVNEVVQRSWQDVGDGDWRDWHNGLTVFTNFIAAAEADSNTDFVVHLGDISSSTEGDYAKRVGEIVDVAAASDVNMVWTWGNHENSAYDGFPYDYNQLWLGVDGNSGLLVKSVTMENKYSDIPFGDANYPHAYTFDVCDCRFIVMFVKGIGQEVQAAQLTWLTERLTETSKPTFVFTHGHLITNSGYTYAYASNHAAVRTILENNGNVQGVFSGHYHRGLSPTVINGIPYFPFRGSTCNPPYGPAENAPDPGAQPLEQAAYFKVTIKPNAIFTGTRYIANIKVEAFNPTNANGKKEYDSYVVTQ